MALGSYRTCVPSARPQIPVLLGTTVTHLFAFRCFCGQQLLYWVVAVGGLCVADEGGHTQDLSQEC